MWYWQESRRKVCWAAQSRLQDVLNRWAGSSTEEFQALAVVELREHLAVCPKCRDEANLFLEARRLLRQGMEQAVDPGEPYTKRIMTAVRAAAEENAPAANLWTVLPAVASRMALVCTLALLLAAVWVRATRAHAPPQQSAASGEMGLVGDSPAESEQVLMSVARGEP